MSERPVAIAALRGFMERHGLGRRDVAVLLGYSSGRSGYNTVTSWLTGRNNPPPFLVFALAELERHLEAEKRGRRT